MLKHIETKEDYAEYEERVKAFRESEHYQFHYDVDENADSHFSYAPCECCNRPLGGDRYNIKIASTENHTEHLEYCVCVDCYYYLEYGQLDDMTMMDLK